MPWEYLCNCCLTARATPQPSANFTGAVALIFRFLRARS